jgi:diguanylate cyclase (GGDEF)-like protein/PAS domain S-box-containing protein
MALSVLQVEDNPTDADLTQRYLRQSLPGIQLTQAGTLAEARACLQASACFDAALLDLKLPDGSGFELLNWIRDRGLPIAVIMLTGAGDQQAAVAALQAGADDYLAKDLASPASLFATLRDACERSQQSRILHSRPLRVLYAEHSAADIDLTRRYLARYAPHIQLTMVADADEVLQHLSLHDAQPPAADVLLLDYRLPGLDALAVVKTLRAERGLDIPIVIISGQGSEAIAAQALHLGANDYLVKHPGYLYELPATLEKVQRQVELARERSNLQIASERLRHVLATSPVILYRLRLEPDGVRLLWVSGNIQRLLDCTEEQALQAGWWSDHLHPDDRESALARLAALCDGGQLTHQYRFFDGRGRMRWIQDELRLPRTGEGQPGEVTGIWRDISLAKLAEQLQEMRVAVLDGLVSDQPLPAMLKAIARRLEAMHPDMRVSILVRDAHDGRLYTSAAPSLPDFYSAAVNGLEAAVGQGSCGTAAATGEAVIVEDITTHPYWTAYVDVAQRADLRACWSVPFKSKTSQVLGTFGIYYAQPRAPLQEELDLIGEFARICGLAVERSQANAALRLAAAVFASTREGVVITDPQPRIISINPAYTAITGYSEADVLDRNPNLMQSGRHDKTFFQAMWGSVLKTGHWQGEIWNRRKNGELFPQLLTISSVYDNEGLTSNYVGVMTDISQLKDTQARIEQLVHHDPLTGLPNRLLLQSRLAHALRAAERQRRGVAVLYIDLDRFKTVNESLGHPVGDELLCALTQRLQPGLRDEDTLGRLGGDEFLLILEGQQRPERAAGIAKDMIQRLEQSFALPSGHEVYIGASIGISLFPQDGASAAELIQHADVAMYQAKQAGRNTYSFYTPSLTREANAKLDLEARLRRAQSQDEFVLHYQPQVQINTGCVIGCEALLRWNSPEQGMISPASFIPLAEETGLIVPLGAWVLSQACAQAKMWHDAGLPDLVMSVNLSARQLRQPDIVASVAAALNGSGLPAEYLKLELTESMIMGQGEQAVALMQELKQLGVHLSIDDFGTGYSSLAYLKRFPIDELKIDQGFVRDIPDDSNDMEIAAAIIGMARGMHLTVIAEGVESEAQRAFLMQQGCHGFQGYLFSRPVPAAEFAQLLAAQEKKISSDERV